MTLYLLDTNIVSDLISDPFGQVGRRLIALSGDTVCTSIVVASELRYGAARKASSRLQSRVEGTLARLSVRPLQPPLDEGYGRLRAALEARGRRLDGNDLLIASHALTIDAVLVSHDQAFTQVSELPLEDWLR